MIRFVARVGQVIVLGALVAACGGGNPSSSAEVTAADRPTVVTSAPTGTLEGSGPVPAEPVPVADRLAVPETAPAEESGRAVAVPGVSDGLLSVVIPPCTPLDGVDLDPCSPQLPPSIYPYGLTASIPSFVRNPPSFDDIMTGMGIDTPHIVVRVTVEPGTTRCEGYPTKDFAYVGGSTSNITNYWCFADMRVNEYIVGAGPPTLTIGLLRNTFLPSGSLDWEQDKDWAIEHEFKNPAARTAATYEGRELVLFLKPTGTMTVEAWTVGGAWDTWFVRRDPATDPPGVTAAWRWENRVISEADLDDLVTEVTATSAGNVSSFDHTPDIIPGPAESSSFSSRYFSLAAGWYYSCAVTTNRSIVCWGSTPFDLAEIPNGTYTTIVAGSSHSCALHTDQSIDCWGSDSSGLIHPPEGKYDAMDTSLFHACALRTDQRIICWGDNSSNQLIVPEGTYIGVATGINHSCGLRTDHTVACWGDNYSGQADPPHGSYISISAGNNFSCGLHADHSISCWGNNASNQTEQPGGRFTSIHSAANNSCALRIDQTIACWGENDFHQSNPPDGLYSAVATSFLHSCGLAIDGSIICWGEYAWKIMKTDHRI